MVHILQKVSAGGKRAILGAAVVATSLPVPVLPDLPPVREDTVPGAYRTAVLGHCLCNPGRTRSSGWTAVWSRSTVHRGALRWLAHVTHDATTPYWNAPNRTSLTKRRISSHRGRVQGSRQSAQV